MNHAITSDIRVALCETNATLRGAFQTALYRRGLRGMEVCRDTVSLISYLDQEVVDLVVVSTDLPGIDFPELIQQIRQQTVGRNPFTVILATVGEATLPEIRQIINAGVDHVARKPISMGDMLGYVNGLASTRKPFVATENYVGPSRRAGSRPNRDRAEVMEVPNTLRSKLVDRISPANVDQMIADGMSGLMELREQNSCWAIWRSVRRITELQAMFGQRDRVLEELNRLYALAEDIETRYRDSENEHFGEIAACLTLLVEALRRLPPTAANQIGTTLNLMERLGDVIRQAGRCDPETVMITHEIAGTVRRFAQSLS